jgi:hypothetical protein
MNLVWDDIKAININLARLPGEDRVDARQRFGVPRRKVRYVLERRQHLRTVPNGKEIPVTPENKSRYIQLCKQVHLAQIEQPFSMMKKGFIKMTPQCYVDMNTPQDFEKEICGSNFVSS